MVRGPKEMMIFDDLGLAARRFLSVIDHPILFVSSFRAGNGALSSARLFTV